MRNRANRKHAEQAHTQQVHATRAWEAQEYKTQLEACTAPRIIWMHVGGGLGRERAWDVGRATRTVMPVSKSHYGLLWATGFVPAENGGAPEIFKTSWGLDRQ